MFRGILQVDGFLIGFVGVLASLAITEFRELLEGFQRNPMTPKEAREDPQMAWLWWIGFERFQDRRWTIVWITGGIVVLLVMSILSALVAMSRLTHIWDCADSGTFILPICAMIAGIDGIFLILVLVAMRGQPSSDGKKSRTSEQ
jgi:hypothetical protein